MPSVDTLTFDANPPHRPALNELGGGAKLDDAVFQPDPITMLTAGDVNQGARQAEAQGRVACFARVWVTMSGGTPTITAVQALGNNISSSSFDVTDEGTGVTLFTWKTGADASRPALPAAVGVRAWQTDDIEIDRVRALLTSNSGDPAARVKTKLGATATDCSFALEIF